MIIAYICLFFLSYFDSESHIGGPSPAGVVVVAVPRAWRLMRSRRPGGPAVAGPVLVPVNLLPFYMLISLSGFLHDTINFDLAKLFNDIQCNSILISSKTDHFTLSF